MSRIFGISIIRTEMSNWNSGFDGRARRDSEGQIFATDKARKFSIRRDLAQNGENVFIISEKENRKYLTLSQKVKKYFNKKPKEKDFLENFIDIRLFGAVLAIEKENMSWTGPTQLLFAKNELINEEGEYEGNELYLDITSYLPTSEKKAEQTTIGKMNVVEKAYYNYPIIIDFNIYKDNLIKAGAFKDPEDTEDIYEEKIKEQYFKDVETLKEAMQYDATNLNSCSKMGTTNFLNIFVETNNENSTLNMASFQYGTTVKETVENGIVKVEVNIENITNELNRKAKEIKKVEIFIPENKKFNISLKSEEFSEDLKDKIKMIHY